MLNYKLDATECYRNDEICLAMYRYTCFIIANRLELSSEDLYQSVLTPILQFSIVHLQNYRGNERKSDSSSMPLFRNMI